MKLLEGYHREKIICPECGMVQDCRAVFQIGRPKEVMGRMMILENKIRCKSCGDIIESKARYD